MRRSEAGKQRPQRKPDLRVARGVGDVAYWRPLAERVAGALDAPMTPEDFLRKVRGFAGGYLSRAVNAIAAAESMGLVKHDDRTGMWRRLRTHY